MYEQTFRLTSRPFTSTPYVKHFFAAQTMQQSLDSCRLCIDRGSGPVVVIGEPGTGKSLLLAMLEEQYCTQFSVINLACARLDERQELLQSILFELHLPYRGMSEGELRLSLMDYLKPSHACPNGVLLLVDEAHNLPVELLDEIRLITNYVRDGQPRVRLVMSGSQRLEERLTDPKLESFNQRIAARCFLARLSQAETGDYVVAHVDRAGGSGQQLFGTSALRAIHQLTDGCPRFINQLCEHALILGSTRGANSISENLVRESWADVQNLPGTFVGLDSSADANGLKNSSAGLKENESWTVIEFGSLDDEETDELNSESIAVDFCSDESPSETTECESVMPEHFDETAVTETRQHDPSRQNDQSDSQNESVAENEIASQSGCDSKCKSSCETGCESKNEDWIGLADDSEPVDVMAGDQSERRLPQSLTDGFGDQSKLKVTDQEQEAHQSVDTSLEPVESEMESTEVENNFDSSVGSDQHAFSDPFAEEFAEEELVTDSYAPLIAQQNQNSTRLTPADVSCLLPLDEPGNSEPVSLESDDEGADEPSRLFSSDLFTDEGDSSDAAELSSTNSETEDSDSTSGYHKHVTDVGSVEIERRAEEIMRSLSVAEEESFETEKTEETVSCGTSGEGDCGPSSTIEFRQKTLEEPTDSTVNDVEQTGVQSGSENDVRENECSDDEAKNTHRLLRDIIQEKNRVAARSFSDADSGGHPTDSRFPNTPEKTDDRDMIVVSQQDDQVTSDKGERGDAIPFPSTPVSTGQAKRMDYQQLFDQLRSTKDD